MSIEYNLEHLFSTRSINRNAEYGDIYLTASLLDHFSKNDLSSFSKEEIEDVIFDSRLLDDNGIYVLDDHIKNEVLSKKINNNTLIASVERLSINSDLAKTLINVLINPNVNIQELSTNELFYLISNNHLFPDRFNVKELKAVLNKKYFFSQFEKITENFAGRDKELASLNDYVNWLPSRTWQGRIENTFRSFIKWHEKPPLIIQGVGGVGKSTLLSKFILEQNNNGRGELPFIYIDFDLPGFNVKEPLAILIEALRQLSIQFYEQDFVFDNISNYIHSVIESNNSSNKNINFRNFNSSISTTRSVVLNSIANLISEYDLKLEQINKPILIVFDSFEEMQFRSSRDEMNNFLSFIKELSERLPRIRPVFSGRSEMEVHLDNFEFEKLELKDFDKASAISLLEKKGIGDPGTAEEIYNLFGGTPLMLHLAMSMVKKNPSSLKDFKSVKTQKKEYLVKRVLEHIHDKKVQKIAVPGMLIRRITPDIIKEVLAKPCGLGNISFKEANRVFNGLKKEVMLIAKSLNDNEIIFRPDLRNACVPIIKTNYIPQSQQIEANVINYYKSRIKLGVSFEAEYYFHLLKKGSIPSELTAELYRRIESYISYSFQEFPARVQAHLHSLLSTKASDKLVQNMTDEEWETYYLTLMKNGLNGDLGYLKVLNDEIEAGKDRFRSSFSEFTIYEVLLYQRLGKFDLSNNLIDTYIKSKIPPTEIVNQLFFVKIQNLEYLNSFDEAKLLAESLINSLNALSRQMNVALAIQYKRIHFRMNLKPPDYLSDEYINLVNLSLGESLYNGEFQYTNWSYLTAEKLILEDRIDTFQTFKSKEEELITFIQKKTIYSSREVQNFDKLEIICNHTLGVFTQSLSLTGEYEVVLKDFMYALEMKNIKLDFIELGDLFKRI